MNAPWSEAQKRQNRQQYARWHSTAHGHKASCVTIPDDIVVMEREPSPCFMCGTAGACRHRPWASDNA